MTDYLNPDFWNIYWNRPYINYEKHHQIFWNEIKKRVKGKTLDIACGSASCWKGFEREDFSLTGIDFSTGAISEGKKNYPKGKFLSIDFRKDRFDPETFDTIVISGLVNYYQDFSSLMNFVKRVSKNGTLVIISINIIKGFDNRNWNKEEIHKSFGQYGEIVEVTFFDKIGWLTVLKINSIL